MLSTILVIALIITLMYKKNVFQGLNFLINDKKRKDLQEYYDKKNQVTQELSENILLEKKLQLKYQLLQKQLTETIENFNQTKALIEKDEKKQKKYLQKHKEILQKIQTLGTLIDNLTTEKH